MVFPGQARAEWRNNRSPNRGAALPSSLELLRGRGFANGWAQSGKFAWLGEPRSIRASRVSPCSQGGPPGSSPRALRHHGVLSAARPESFLIEKSGKLVGGEAVRARAWGEQLARSDCLANVVKQHKG